MLDANENRIDKNIEQIKYNDAQIKETIRILEIKEGNKSKLFLINNILKQINLK